VGRGGCQGGAGFGEHSELHPMPIRHGTAMPKKLPGKAEVSGAGAERFRGKARVSPRNQAKKGRSTPIGGGKKNGSTLFRITGIKRGRRESVKQSRLAGPGCSGSCPGFATLQESSGVRGGGAKSIVHSPPWQRARSGSQDTAAAQRLDSVHFVRCCEDELRVPSGN